MLLVRFVFLPMLCIKNYKMIFRLFFVGSVLMTAHAISSGANEPIADNELGLTAKDCALQYCEELDALALWLTLVDPCTHWEA
jgi:hypothetical protein